MAGEGDPQGGVKPELDGYFAQFSVDALRDKERDLQRRIETSPQEAKQLKRALRRVQGTIAAKVEEASGVQTGADVKKEAPPARPTEPPRAPAQERQGGGGIGATVRAAAGRVADVVRGGGRAEPAKTLDPAAAVRRDAADVRTAAPGASPATIAASPSTATGGGGSAYAQKQAAGAGGRGPTGPWGIEAELGIDEDAA